MPFKITSLSLKGFRGSLLPISLEFPNPHGNIVIYGENAAGKSSFIEAIEWFYTGIIEALEREFCYRESYRNLQLPPGENAEVGLSFSQTHLNSVKSLPASGPPSQSNSDPQFEQYLSISTGENFILRYENLQDFIEKTKGDKLEHFAKLVGFQKIIETRDVLMQAFNALKNSQDLGSLNGQLQEAKRFLVQKLETEIFNEASVAKFATEEAKRLGFVISVSRLADFPSVVTELKQVDPSLAGKRLQEIQILKVQFDTSTRRMHEIVGKIEVFLNSYGDFLHDIESVRKQAFRELYAIGKRILESELWPDKQRCPLCNRPDLDGHALIQHLAEEIAKIDQASEEKRGIDTLYSDLLREIDRLRSDHQSDDKTIYKDTSLSSLKNEFHEKVTSLTSSLETVESTITTNFKNLNATVIDIGSLKAQVANMKSTYQNISSALDSEKAKIAIPEKTKKSFELAVLLEQLKLQFERYSTLSERAETYNHQVDNLRLVQEAFEKKEKEAFTLLISVLSHDIDKYYGILNPGYGVRNIRLFTTEDVGAGRGIEIRYDFHGSPQYPARKYLSEGHRNALGLCIFLASARYFNRENHFIALDDVVTNFDTDHRERLVNLFRHEDFVDREFLIATVDSVWFKFLQRTFQGDPKWRFYEIKPWSPQTGIQVFEPPTSIRAKIIRMLSDGNLFGAQRSIRSYYEETLKTIAKKLEVLVPFNEDGRWQPNDLFSGIVRKVKGTVVETDTRFRDGNPIGFLANLAAHENDENITSGTVNNLIECIDKLRQAFNCANCSRPIWEAKRQDGTFQCKCGQMRC